MADVIETLIDTTIATRCNSCIHSFTRLYDLMLKRKGDFTHEIVLPRLKDEFGRFRVWAGNIGAHRVGRVSLDYRLREASHMHGRVTDLLDDLIETLSQGKHTLLSTVFHGVFQSFESILLRLCPRLSINGVKETELIPQSLYS
jgi:hypothetical protein